MDQMHLYVLADEREDYWEVQQALEKIEYIQFVGVTTDEEEAWAHLELGKVNVLLVAPRNDQGKYAFVERATQQFPLTPVILLEEEWQEETLHNALYLGAKDVLVRPFDGEKLLQSLIRVQQLSAKKADPQTYKASIQGKKKSPGKIYTFFSTKGGVGKTFLSLNFATALAADTQKRVVLVDLDLDCGNAALAMNLPPKFTILDVLNEIHNMDNDLIESYLLPHESGVKVLAANVRYDMKGFIKADQVKIVLELLQQSFDYVIVDMPPRFSENSAPAMALADLLLLVATPEVSSVRNTKSLLVTLQQLSFPPSKVRLILNKAMKRSEISEKDITSTLNQKLDAAVAYDYQRVLSSLNRGVPFIKEYPKHPITGGIHNLVKTITGVERKEEKKRVRTLPALKLARGEQA